MKVAMFSLLNISSSIRIESFLFLISFLLFSCFVFIYIFCFIGPHETSIRMRIIKELSKNKNGISLENLLTFYNPKIILEKRLERLLLSGDILRKDNTYTTNKNINPFTIIDNITKLLKNSIHHDA